MKIVHEIAYNDEESWDHDLWPMRCGLLVQVADDASLTPDIDFVLPSGGWNPLITCEDGCKATKVEPEVQVVTEVPRENADA